MSESGPTMAERGERLPDTLGAVVRVYWRTDARVLNPDKARSVRSIGPRRPPSVVVLDVNTGWWRNVASIWPGWSPVGRPFVYGGSDARWMESRITRYELLGEGWQPDE